MNLKSFYYEYLEAWNTRNHEKLKQFYHKNFEMTYNPDPFYSITKENITIEERQMKNISKLESFPDLQFHPEQVVTDNQSTISVFGFYTGTHKGEYKGIPGTGKFIKQEAAIFFELKDNKILKIRRIADNLSIYLDLGHAVMESNNTKLLELYLDNIKEIIGRK